MKLFPIKQEFKNKYADVICLIYFADICNYACDYCYNRKPYSNKFIDVNKLILFLTNLSQNNTKKIAIELIGGEPTLHPKLFYFLDNIKNISIVDICIFTNFSKSIEYYETLIVKYNARILATWHSTLMDMHNLSFVNKIFNIKKEIFDLQSCNKLKNLFIRIMAEIPMFNYSCKLKEEKLSI